jgi:spore coat protein A, manganese oxidase
VVTDDHTQDSPCVQPFNLDGMEELFMILADKVLDDKCQLRFDHEGVHHNNLYGDINLVNGIPWPVMHLQPKWYHFRLLNGGPTRPFLLKIKDSYGKDVAPSMCHVVGGDGGARRR